MDIVYRRAPVSVADVLEGLPDAPSYSAVRALLRILEEKGHLRHEEDGQRYLYRPTVPREKARRSALSHVVTTFFEGSASQVVATLLDVSGKELSDSELDAIEQIINEAREEGR